MKRIFLLSLLCLSLAARAQDLPTGFERLEGTLSATQNGVTTHARLQWEKPDSLRIDIEANEAALIPAQTIIAMGDQTLLYLPQSKRVQRLPYNLARQAWRGNGLRNGGPANVALFGLSRPDLEAFYNLTTTGTTLDLKARPEFGRRMVRDLVRFEGGGEGASYAAWKRPVFDRPEQISLNLNARGQIETLSFGPNGSRAQISYDAASGLPRAATVTRSDGAVESTFAYDLTARAEAFPAATFALDTSNQVIEDAELRPLAEYQSATDASGKFNLGVALARHTEDFASAFAAWDEAARLNSQAVAPPLAIFEAALTTRDLARARTALDSVSALLGSDNFEVSSRRARLLALQRDWDGSLRALESAQQAAPQNLAVTLLRADLLRARGQFEPAQTLLLDILKSRASQTATQISAAETLAVMTDPSQIDALLQSLPRDTMPQRLARAHLQLLQSANAPAQDDTPPDDAQLKADNAQLIAQLIAQIVGTPANQADQGQETALASLALGQERAGQTTQAIATWTALSARTVALEGVAQTHLIALYATRGEVGPSLKAWRALLPLAVGEAARQRSEDLLLDAWRKAFRQDQLRAVLQNRALSSQADDADLRLWVAFQDTNGGPDDVAQAVALGLTKFAGVAWWNSRAAESLVEQAQNQPISAQAFTAQEKLTRDAISRVEDAVRLDPSQPYYAMQRTLILAQRAAMTSKILNPQNRQANEARANAALDDLEKGANGDPDILLAVAVARFRPDAAPDAAITGLQNALQAGMPGRDSAGGDRHAFVLAARQALAVALRRARRPEDAARQYDTLLAAARDAGEESSITSNFLILLGGADEAQTAPYMAQFLARLAAEPWSHADARKLLNVGTTLVLRQSKQGGEPVAALLRDARDPAQVVAFAALSDARLAMALAALEAPTAPPSADAQLRRARQDDAASLSALQALVTAQTTAGDTTLSGRAASILAERLLNANQNAEAVPFLQAAIKSEPRDIGLRVALASALIRARQTDAALQARDEDAALQARDEMERVVPHTVGNDQQFATLSLRLARPQDALRDAQFALHAAQASPDATAADAQVSALLVGRAAFGANRPAVGDDIFAGLIKEQWARSDRIAALLDLQRLWSESRRPDQAARIGAQLNALNPTQDEANAAQQLLDNLD